MERDIIVVGVDGGGTGSRAVALGLDGREQGRADGPPALVRDIAPDRAAGVVADLVREVAAAAGVGTPVAVLVAGLAGVGRPGVRGVVHGALVDAGVADEVEVLGDSEVAFHDAFGAGAGILLVGGTGSMALGRSHDGRTARAGGWGDPLGDEGSGWFLGMSGLRAVARAADGRGPWTQLTNRLLDALDLADPPDLIRWTAAATKKEVAALAPHVLEAAASGDVVAVGLADDAARELAEAVEAVRRSLEPWAEPPEVAVAGGLIGAGAPLRARVDRALAELLVRPSARTVVPVRGAARRALEIHSREGRDR
jgi:N-acetylglucosamine kinase-like BadF-type ATPase